MKCENFDVTGYWRLSDASWDVETMVDKEKLCTCWVPVESGIEIPDVFCEPQRGCGDVASGRNRTLAATSPNEWKC
jgi:hypothetical protein